MRPRSFTRTTLLLGASFALCAGLAAGSARADLVTGSILLVPDGPVVPLTGEAATNLNGETFLGDFMGVAQPTSSPISASFNSAVYRDSTGLLDFVYQLTNNTGSVALQSITVTNFNQIGGVDTANTLTGPLPANATNSPGGNPAGGSFVSGTTPTLSPANVQQTSSGGSIIFGFDGNPLQPGQTSDLFFVHTNATFFNKLGLGVALSAQGTNGGSASFFTTFEPTNAVPEPSVTVMLGVAGLFGGLGYYRKSRGRAAA